MLVLPAPYMTCRYAGTPKTIFEHANMLYSQHHVLTCRYSGSPKTIYWHGGMPVLPTLCWHASLLVLRTSYLDMPDFGRPQRNIKIRNSEPVLKFMRRMSSSEWIEARGKIRNSEPVLKFMRRMSSSEWIEARGWLFFTAGQRASEALVWVLIVCLVRIKTNVP